MKRLDKIKKWFKPKPKPWLTRDAKGQLVTASDIKAKKLHGSYGCSGGGSTDSSSLIIAACMYSDL
jgi:hypothetical protein